jgi:hypothetical protein
MDANFFLFQLPDKFIRFIMEMRRMAWVCQFFSNDGYQGAMVEVGDCIIARARVFCEAVKWHRYCYG